jgi:hypothetical protein
MQDVKAGVERTLGALAGVIDKADAHCTARKIDPAALMQARLYPDMFPFTRQVQLASDFAVRGWLRLAGAEPPAIPDTEASLPELAARARLAQAHVAGITAAALDGAAARTVTFRTRLGERSMAGSDYLHHFLLPNVYFHVTTAYNILRHNGVEVGKTDFIGA